MRRAVIDVGSNSVLLLVGEKTNGDWKYILDTSEVSALGADVKKTGKLGEEGMSATLTALKRAFAKGEELGAEVRAFGTMALRIAQNAAEFQTRAQEQGTPVEIISGEMEAELGMECVVKDPKFRDCARLTIVDVGGQSTEIAAWAQSQTEFQKSYPIGTLALRSGALSNESPSSADILRASAEIDDTFGSRFLKDKAGTVVVLGATGTNLVTIREQMQTWQPEKVHGAHLDFEEVSKFVGASCRMSDSGRAALIGIEKGREKTIHIGALILERALQMAHALGCYVSVRGWRHAMLERL